MERELLLLGLLRQRSMHGYQLQEFINRDLEYCTDLKQSTAYNLLKGMSEKGWVTTTQEQEGNRPPRTVYEITNEGEAISSSFCVRIWQITRQCACLTALD